MTARPGRVAPDQPSSETNDATEVDRNDRDDDAGHDQDRCDPPERPRDDPALRCLREHRADAHLERREEPRRSPGHADEADDRERRRRGRESAEDLVETLASGGAHSTSADLTFASPPGSVTKKPRTAPPNRAIGISANSVL